MSIKIFEFKQKVTKVQNNIWNQIKIFEYSNLNNNIFEFE